MKPVVVKQMLLWLQRSDPEFRHITLYRFFNTAYFWHFRCSQPARVTEDMALMEMKGQVPFYLQLFIRKRIYPMVLRITPVVQPKLLV